MFVNATSKEIVLLHYSQDGAKSG